MVFDSGVADSLYYDFRSKTHIKSLWGDQDYIGKKMPNLDTFPLPWIEKIKNCPGLVPTKRAKVILCMGEPGSRKNKTFANRIDWVKEVWQ